MYPWLADAIDQSACVLTSSRRLARTLREHSGLQRLESGLSAWPTPRIYYWRDWLRVAVTGVADRDPLPVRITAIQSRVIWERCLARTIDDPLFHRGMLSRQVQDAWNRLQDWQVSVDACERSARSRDHFAFVRAARCYEATIKAGNWVDPAGLPGLCTQLVRQNRVIVPERVCAAGFDRLAPGVTGLFDALCAKGSDVKVLQPDREPRLDGVYAYESTEAELRAAGSWARSRLEENGAARLAVIVPDLERHAGQTGRLVQEGLLPGWQNSSTSLRRAANVSFGQPLNSYPAIRIASLLLRWLHSDLSSDDISILLCSSLLGAGVVDDRCRLEMFLRRRPGQFWSPEGISAVLAHRMELPGTAAWFTPLARLTRKRAALPERASPASWAATFDAVLEDFGWPGTETLASDGFQLVNRWRELLNELSRLTLVEASVDATYAQRRLESMAAETLFQPEAADTLVQVLGPLEAAGLEFDGIWIARMTAANWPPPGQPLTLVSRELQRDNGMPDATPEDTLRYGTRILDRLLGSGTTVVVSHALHAGDTEQSPSRLISGFGVQSSAGPEDPGWHASRLLGRVPIVRVAAERVPRVAPDESISGGAATIQYQLTDPFSAFVRGRLGVRPLEPFRPGITPQLRGNLVHEALRHLYSALPDAGQLLAWQGRKLEEKVRAAVAQTFLPVAMHADPLLRRLLELEQRRTAGLLGQVIALDRHREEFAIAAVEAPVDAVIEGVRLSLRVDRIDARPNGALMVWDYKTGSAGKFLNRDGDPADYQLVVYCCALDGPVAGLGLYNIDSRTVGVDDVGVATMSGPEWEAALARWRAHVREAARAFAAGDVRIKRARAEAAGRSLAILGRYGDVDDGA